MTRIFICSFITIVALGAAGIVQPHHALGVTIELGVGQSKIVGDKGLEVGFDEVLYDSRCPIGLLCIWEGDASTQIWALQPPNPKVAAELHTYHGFQQQFKCGDYNIKLLKLIPYPHVSIPIDPEDYVVTLLVEAIATPVEYTTWSRIKALYR